jgi:RHS repeat-associated protein
MDSSRNVVQSYTYDSFGLPKPQTAFRNSYTYTAREWDKETGLYYYRARYYDPMEGRFISKDPKSFAGGDANLYGYVQNDPINGTDPSGLFGIGGGFGATLGVVSLGTSINYKECCSNGKRHKRTVRTWCLGYELGLSLKGTSGAKGGADNSSIQACPAGTQRGQTLKIE